ncbi:FAD-dependent monooxygenase [Streptomyces decoyicus]
MKSSTQSDVVFDVLVVGAGPSGLLLACELLDRGVRVRIIDALPEPTQVPRALSIYPRAFDILEDRGLRDEVLGVSGTVRTLSYFSDHNHLASFRLPAEHAPRVLPQYETERILTEKLESLGGKVERGIRLLALEGVDHSGRIETTSGVTAVLETADGTVERAFVPFAVGADGAGSSVRGQLGIGFQGSTYGLEFALVDAKVDGDLSPEEILYYQGAGGTLAVVPQPNGVFRFLSVLPPGSNSAGVEMMQEIVDERGPRGIRITEPVWTTVFRVHARLASEFQLGRVFLIGDAAHVHSPAGGQGMNNGLQDANNLGWKLASVIKGVSPSSLLATYGPERAEATQRTVRDTDLHTRAWMVSGRAKVWARDAGFRLAERTGGAARFYAPVLAGRRQSYTPQRAAHSPSGLAPCRALGKLPAGVRPGGLLPRKLALAYGVSGPGADPLAWTIAVSEPAHDTAWIKQVEHIATLRQRVRVVSMSPRDVAAATGCHRPGYHLVRPDGHIAAHGHEKDLDRLGQELGTTLNRVR